MANRVDNVFNFVLDTYMNYIWSPEGPAFANSLYAGVKLAFSWLLRSSEAYGVPEARLNTNDEHGIMGDVGACECDTRSRSVPNFEVLEQKLRLHLLFAGQGYK